MRLTTLSSAFSSPLLKESRPPLRTTAVLYGSVISFVLLFYGRLLHPDTILIQRDAFRMHLPLRHYLAERFRGGSLPLWYPYDGLGRPFVDISVGAVFHPFTALTLFLSPATAYKASVLACVLVGAFGTLALARRLGFRPSSSLIAGAGFVGSGYFASLTDNTTYLYTLAILPWFLLCIDRAATGHRRAWLAIGALLWATVFLNGDPQGGLIFGLVAGAWSLWRAAPSRLRSLLVVGTTAFLAALLAAIQLIPTWVAYQASSRSNAMAHATSTLQWSTDPRRLIQLFLRPVAEDSTATEIASVFFNAGTAGYWSRSIYVGLPLLALIFGASRQHLRRYWPLLALAAATLLLALGDSTFLFPLARRLVPFWSAFRYPEKFIGFFSFFLALAAALGADSLLSGQLSHKRLVASIAAMLLSASSFLLWPGLFALSVPPPALVDSLVSSLEDSTLHLGLLTLGLVAIAFGRTLLRPSATACLLFLLVAADLTRANSDAYRTGPRAIATFAPPLLDALEETESASLTGRYRVVSLRLPRYAVPQRLKHEMGTDAEVVAVRHALDQSHNGVFKLESPASYLPGESRDLKAILMDQVLPGTLAHFNVKYLIGSEQQFASYGLGRFLIATLPDFDLALLANPKPPLPRAYIPRIVERVSPQADYLALVRRPDFQNGQVDFIETHLEIDPPPQDAYVNIVEHEPERVSLVVNSSRPTWVILSDAFDSGWEASLRDGTALPISRANALVRAVVAPAGKNEIIFRYRPVRILVGASISGVGLILALLASIFDFRRN